MPRQSDWRLCAGCACGFKPRAADVRPEGGARCVSSARRDLCGERGAILVPTATLGVLNFLHCEILYSITSSALPRSVSGKVRPNTVCHEGNPAVLTALPADGDDFGLGDGGPIILLFFCGIGTLPVGPIAVTCKITSPSFAHA